MTGKVTGKVTGKTVNRSADEATGKRRDTTRPAPRRTSSAQVRSAQPQPGRRERGLRPYLNVFLLVHREWSATTVGLVTTLAGLVGVGLQAPLGAVIDRARDKRLAIVAALMAASAGAVVIALGRNSGRCSWPSRS